MNVFELLFLAKERVIYGELHSVRSLLDDFCLDRSDPDQQMLYSYVQLLAEGAERDELLSLFEGYDKYWRLPNSFDSKCVLALKCELGALISCRKNAEGKLFDENASRFARSLYSIAHSGNEFIESLYLFMAAAEIRVMNGESELFCYVTMAIVKLLLTNKEKSGKINARYMFLGLFGNFFHALKKTKKDSRCFGDVLKEMVMDLERDHSPQDIVIFLADFITKGIPPKLLAKKAMKLLSELSSKAVPVLWGEVIIREILSRVDIEGAKMSKYQLFSSISDALATEEYLFPHIILMDHYIDEGRNEELIKHIGLMLSDLRYPSSIKAYLKAYLGELKGDRALIVEGVNEALELFRQEDSTIAMYVLRTYCEYVT